MGIQVQQRQPLRSEGWMGVTHNAIHPGTLAWELEELPSNRARAAFCRDKAAAYRAKYWDGQREVIDHVLTSHSHQFGWYRSRGRWRCQYSTATLTALAKRRFSTTPFAKDCIGQEQMWSRFAEHYLAMCQLDQVL